MTVRMIIECDGQYCSNITEEYLEGDGGFKIKNILPKNWAESDDGFHYCSNCKKEIEK